MQPIWISPGNLGFAIANSAYSLTLQANAILPASTITYVLIAGSLPPGISLSGGVISGILPSVDINTQYSWTIRAIDNLGNFRDQGFTIINAPQPAPYFTDVYTLVSTIDSTWIERQVLYYNTDPVEPIVISLEGGILPVGLELTSDGIIRGYAEPPLLNQNVSSYSHFVDSVNLTTLRTSTTSSLKVGAQVVYSSSGGNITAGSYYYIREILNSTDYTISEWQGGVAYNVGTVSGILGIQQSGTETTPIKRSYPIKLKLSSDLGIDLGQFEIQIINQNLPISQGGPGFAANTRIPVIVNSQTIIPLPDISWSPYLLPPPRSPATIINTGVFPANETISWRVLGYDFDNDDLTYTFSGLPVGLTGDPSTGWVTGTVLETVPSINTYSWSVQVYKTSNPAIISSTYNFSTTISLDVTNDITWNGPTDLGMLVNCQISELSVANASSINDIKYRLATGSSLPGNLYLTESGLIAGKVADQPTNDYLQLGDITNFSFTIEAYNPLHSSIVSSRTFSLKILQAFSEPNENLYFKALCDLETRKKVSAMLNNSTLIPKEKIYRLDDPNFGIAKSVTVGHAYGILSSSIDEYLTAVQKNHYFRQIVLGEIKTAVATDDDGNVIYEVVYSKIIDDLINNAGISIPSTITWPRMISYGLSWYTSLTQTFTSYIQLLQQSYFTALTPLSTNTLHPASLPNMRDRVVEILGSVPTFKLLPRWMTSPQPEGSAPGYVPAWVICYTKPGESATIANNLKTVWDYVLHDVNFELDRFFVDRSSTFNLQPNLANKTWLTLPSGSPLPNPKDRHDFQIYFPQKTILPE